VRNRACARLGLGLAATIGAFVFTVHLGQAPATAAVPTGPVDAQASLEQGLTPVAPGAPGTSYGAGVVVVDESQPHTHVVDPATGGLVSVRPLDAVVPGQVGLGPVHLDPVPADVDLSDPTDTGSLVDKAGAVQAALAAGDQPVSAGATAPLGTPGVSSLSSHVVPSCSGTGTDGKRVQVLYVHDAATPSRFADVLPVLRNEVATVDDVFAVSAQQTGGDRRVRWVHDAACQPVIKDVTVPAGALGASFNDTVQALTAQGYNDKNRKYLAFADANQLCGIGTLYNDTRLTANYNDGYAASYARVDANCWSTSHSVAAHELTHNLGGVQQGAPHATTGGHCWDESDIMCYDDGSGVRMKNVCQSSQEQLLDCNHDDYFSTSPRAGTFLAGSWNVASSGFLDPGPAPSAGGPDVAVTAAVGTGRAGDPVALTATSTRTVTWTWSATSGCTVAAGAGGSATLTCPASTSGTVTVSAVATEPATGATGSGTTTVAQTAVTSGVVTTSWSQPAVSGGDVSATLQGGGAPQASVPVRLQMQASTGTTWSDVLTTSTDGSGRVAATARVPKSSLLRFVYDGDATRAASTSAAVRVKVAVRIAKATTAPRLATATLVSWTGDRVGGERLVLQRRDAGRAWRTVAAPRTDRAGRVVLRVRPARGTAWRWLFPGDSTHQRAVGARFTVPR
jgi:hypothetical protein